MPRIEQTEQPRGTTGGSTYSETAEQKAGWAKLADWIEDSLEDGTLIEGDTFKVKGYVQSMNLDNGKYFKKTFKDRTTGEEKVTTTTKLTAVITDERFVPAGVLLPLPTKDFGTSFFDGRLRDGTRGIARGSMYHLHLAVTYAEPPQELVDNKGSWDTDDYCGPDHPVLLVVTFAGWEPEGSQYYNSRASLKVFLDKFERDLEAKKAGPKPSTSGRSSRRAAVEDDVEEGGNHKDGVDLTGDDFDDDPPTPPVARGGTGRTSGRSRTTAERAGSGSTGPGTAGTMRIVDAPVDLAASPTRGRSRAGSAGAAAGGSNVVASTATASVSDPALQKATERQVKFIYAIAREAGLDEQEVTIWSQDLYSQDIEQLNRRDASSFIEALQRRRNEVA